MLKILSDYILLVRKKDARKDILFSLLAAIVAIIALRYAAVPLNDLMARFGQLSGTMITAFSILAGFNTASLTVLATADSPAARSLRERQSIDGSRPLIDQILVYFSWAIVVQLTMLLFSITFMLVIVALPEGGAIIFPYAVKVAVWVLMATGVFGVVYAILLTLRNIAILYYFLIAKS